MKKLALQLLCLMLLSAAKVSAAATITLTTEQWPPNNYLDDNGKVIGIATEKVRLLFDKAGIKYTIELMPWARAYHKTLHNPNTAIYSIMRSQSREALFQWVCPLVDPTPIFFYKLASRTDIIINNLEDVKKYLISVSKNEFDHQYLRANGFVVSKDYYVSFDDKTLLKKLLNGRIDLMMGTEYAIISNTKELGFDVAMLSQAMEVKLPEQNPTCLAFSLTTPESTVEKIRQALISTTK